jgi:alpha,alpha-trehalose phosphorylase
MEEIKHIKDHIYLPFSKEHNIYMQDDNFLNKKRLDISSLPKEKFPLLLHYHPLFLYKHQVLKQADTMLALLLLDYDQLDVLESSYDYYEPITTHDSSLSQCIYSILAYRLNRYEQANRQLLNVLKTDLDDIQGNTSHGLHVANLGGSYLVFMYGIVGLRIHREYVTLRPLKTEEFSHYQFQFMYKGTTVFVEVNESLTVQTTQPLQFKIYDEMITVDGITTFRIQ